MTLYAKLFHPYRTPQTQRASAQQVINSAGGYSFAVSDWDRLQRFLVLGSETGSYYARPGQLTRDNALAVLRCLSEDGARAVSSIVDTSVAGRAPKNSPAIFALALAAAHPDDATRAAALAALPHVCRTSAHLFEFLSTVKEFRGWGRGLRKAVCRWYVGKSSDQAAYQMVKYRARSGFTHRDALRLAGGAIRQVGEVSPQHEALFRWATAGQDGLGAREVDRGGQVYSYAAMSTDALPRLVQAYACIQTEDRPQRAAELIREHRLTHEMVPSHLLRHRDVWRALGAQMPMTALLRNLGRLTSLGVLARGDELTAQLIAQLRDGERLRKAKVHPLSVLVALNTYAQGRGVKGALTWKPLGKVKAALEDAFDLCFGFIPASGARTLLALDVSGSMGWGQVAGMTGVTPRVGAAAMAMATMRVEPHWMVKGFSSKLVDIPIHPRMSLGKVMRTVSRIPMGGTDCAAPMRWALEHCVPVDVFIVYTDSETWYGGEHPHEALRRYRQKMGIDAKLIVVGMISNGFTIADPNDAGMLDVVGFDTAAPRVMTDFIRGQ